MKVLIHVQHLLGSGHFVRMALLAEALAKNNHQVILVSGGRPVPFDSRSFELVQLPEIHCAPGDFTVLLDEQGKTLNETKKQQRSAALQSLVVNFNPDILLIESYPFGRKQFEFELEPLIRTAKGLPKKPLIVSSIRDVLQQRTELKERKAVEKIQKYFDGVLVHGDEDWVPIKQSFSLWREIDEKLKYTGYICKPNPDAVSGVSRSNRQRNQEILVSAGGGAVGKQLIEIVLQTINLLSHDNCWRIRAGNQLDKRYLNYQHPDPEFNVIIEENKPDFVQRLGTCMLSISQAGYNTCMDVLTNHTPAVFVPYAQAGETEQLQRSSTLQNLGRSVMIEEKDLSPELLARAIEDAIALDITKFDSPNTDGLTTSAALLQEMHERHELITS